MKLTTRTIILLVVAAATSASAAPREIPAIVSQGFAAYGTLGVSAAMKMWLKGSPLEDTEEASEEAAVLAEATRQFGRPESFEILEVSDLGSRTSIVYVVIHHERGPLFGSFLVYRVRTDWIVNRLKFRALPELVLTETMLGR